jgi:hypothetical protein
MKTDVKEVGGGGGMMCELIQDRDHLSSKTENWFRPEFM